jgi:hypothetical protein
MGVSHGRLTIKLDSTDHLYIEHETCGKNVDIRTEKPEFVGVGGGYKILWFEVNCRICKTGWCRWRKAVLCAAEGECVLPRRR